MQYIKDLFLQFIKSYYLFILFCFLSLSFLIFQDGYWLYVDAAGWPMHIDRYKQMVIGGINSFTQFSYFGHDATVISSSRLIQTFTKILPIEIFYLSFFIFSFFSSFHLLQIFFNKKASFYGALLFSFNPISLYFLKQIGYLYAYFSLPLILFGVIKYYQTFRIKYLLLFILGMLFFISYTRLSGIYFLFLLLIGCYYYKDIIYILTRKTTRWVIMVLTLMIVLSPFILGLFFPYIDGNKEYFTGLGNYTDSFASYQKTFSTKIAGQPFIESFYVNEIMQDFGSKWYAQGLFIFSSLVLILGNLFYFLFNNNSKQQHRKIALYLCLILLLVVFIKAGAKFIGISAFSKVAYSYFPFIANNTNWLFILYIPITVFILSYNYQNSNVRGKNIILGATLFYIFLSIFPLVNFNKNIKSHLVDIKKMSPNYHNFLIKKNDEVESALYFPQNTLLLKGNPYHIKLHYNVNYAQLFHYDQRSVNSKQTTMNKLTSKVDKNEHINFGLFNLKNIFVFKDIQDVKNGTFDWYRGEGLEAKSEKQYNFFRDHKDLYIKKKNSSYTQFGIKGDNKFDYFIYSPAQIIRHTPKSFSKKKLDLTQKLINIDPESFNQTEKIKNLEIHEKNKNIKITYKKSDTNTTKYYLKISDFNPNKSFLLQLNQTFGMSWKLKWITKNDYEDKECINNLKFYPITDNSNCRYSENYFSTLSDTKYLKYPEVNPKNHFEGNFVGNTWLIEKQDLPQGTKNGSPLYAVIIFDKQVYYIWSILLAGITLISIIVAIILQELFLYYKKGK